MRANELPEQSPGAVASRRGKTSYLPGGPMRAGRFLALCGVVVLVPACSGWWRSLTVTRPREAPGAAISGEIGEPAGGAGGEAGAGADPTSRGAFVDGGDASARAGSLAAPVGGEEAGVPPGLEAAPERDPGPGGPVADPGDPPAESDSLAGSPEELPTELDESPGEPDRASANPGPGADPVRAKPPVAPAEPPYGDRVEQYGITWKFDRKVRLGRFVTGDYWVVGPVTVVEILPAGGEGRNGSMLNPVSQTPCGYDSRIPYYDASLRADPPIRMVAGDSLVSTISNSSPRVKDLLGKRVSHGFIKSGAVLTCVAEPASPTAFRPPYVKGPRPTLDSQSIRWELLPDLEPVPGALAYGTLGPLAARRYGRYFARPWILHVRDWVGRQAHPTQNMPNYHREVYNVIADAALLLLCDIPDREELMIGFLQVGIDMHYCSRSGGADSSLHKWNVIFTGIMLDVDEMRKTSYGGFRTDKMTYYPDQSTSKTRSKIVPEGEGWTGAKVLWRQKRHEGWEHEHLHPSEWDRVKIGKGGIQREAYRRSNSYTWPGVALAARIMGAVDFWNHPAFFEYVDRWMTEPDAENRRQLESLWKKDLLISGGGCGSDFVRRMWETYRSRY